MKYLKCYEIFSTSEIKSRNDEILDLFLDLTDNGYTVEVDNDNKRINIYLKSIDLPDILYSKGNKVFKINDIREVLDFSLRYLQNKYELYLVQVKVDYVYGIIATKIPATSRVNSLDDIKDTSNLVGLSLYLE